MIFPMVFQEAPVGQPFGPPALQDPCDALRRGLEMSAAHGFNPYRFGFIGSSDVATCLCVDIMLVCVFVLVCSI